jgi:3-hydroxybutyryl-CoA dehydrogenase
LRVVVVGTGLMGSQIGTEFALAGNHVTFISRSPRHARHRIDRSLTLADTCGLFTPAQLAAARTAIDIAKKPQDAFELAVESVPEDLELKTSVLRRLAAAAHSAILASNTSSLSITALGGAIGEPRRVIGMHYWSPPLLMPLVEVARGEGTDGAIALRVEAIVRGLGKHPVRVLKDVPGLVWNRLQFALLREAVWLVENGVATPETIDDVVRDGLARRWRHVGPFQAVALGGRGTWLRAGANLTPELSTASELADIPSVGPRPGVALERLRVRIDRKLASDLASDREHPVGTDG